MYQFADANQIAAEDGREFDGTFAQTGSGGGALVNLDKIAAMKTAALILACAFSVLSRGQTLSPTAEFNLGEGRNGKSFLAAGSSGLTFVGISDSGVRWVSADFDGRILHTRSDLASVNAHMPLVKNRTVRAAAADSGYLYLLCGTDVVKADFGGRVVATYQLRLKNGLCPRLWR